MSAAGRTPSRDLSKYLFFTLVAACILLVIAVDERFLINPADREWHHIAPFRWLLLLHGLAGATALFIGPFQFSDRVRRNMPLFHRWLGRTYVTAILAIAAPMGLWIGIHFEPASITVEQWFQAGGWWLTTLIAFLSIRRRDLARHKLWMMRSYGFCLVFVASRVPDAWMNGYSDQFLSDELWSLVIAALLLPDLILMLRTRTLRHI